MRKNPQYMQHASYGGVSITFFTLLHPHRIPGKTKLRSVYILFNTDLSLDSLLHVQRLTWCIFCFIIAHSFVCRLKLTVFWRNYICKSASVKLSMQEISVDENYADGRGVSFYPSVLCNSVHFKFCSDINCAM